ncbi:MAG: hypothetical protein ACRD0W_07890 [Acidimicrobiales bacterium]
MFAELVHYLDIQVVVCGSSERFAAGSGSIWIVPSSSDHKRVLKLVLPLEGLLDVHVAWPSSAVGTRRPKLRSSNWLGLTDAGRQALADAAVV